MGVGAKLVTDAKAPVLVDLGQRPLHRPAGLPSPLWSSIPFSGRTGSTPICSNPWRCGSES